MKYLLGFFGGDLVINLDFDNTFKTNIKVNHPPTLANYSQKI